MSNGVVLNGVPVVGGIGIGTAAILHRHIRFPKRWVGPQEADAELERLRDAIQISKRELESLQQRLQAVDKVRESTLILDAYLLMLQDKMLLEGVKRRIEEKQINAEWALWQFADSMTVSLRQSDSPYLRDRALDIQHVVEHVIRTLGGGSAPRIAFEQPTVLVADDFAPADAVQMLRPPVVGLVMTRGGTATHTAIVARAMKIPTVVGVDQASSYIHDGDMVAVDGLRGQVIVRAGESQLTEIQARSNRYVSFTNSLRAKRNTPAQTEDGQAVSLLANLELSGDASLVKSEGAVGIGLYRTEFLFLDSEGVPSEEMQFEAYSNVVRTVAPLPIVFRTFDLGSDKLRNGNFRAPEGARGLQYLLAHPDIFRTQLRAILRASAFGQVRIMFPLVTEVKELRIAKQITLECAKELQAEGTEIAPFSIGIMVEVPSAALLAEDFARECDFFAVGTNDLVRYLFATERERTTARQVLSPACLRLLQHVNDIATQTSQPLSLCGDAATDPLILPLLLGLGFTTLSLPFASMPLVREVICRLRMDEMRALVSEMTKLSTHEEVLSQTRSRLERKLGDLWQEHGI